MVIGLFFCTRTQVHLRDEKILWQCRLKDEDDEHYHRRVLSFARERQQGVKYRSGGGKDLGVRKLPSDKDQVGPMTVSILGVPADWDSQDLTNFLAG